MLSKVKVWLEELSDTANRNKMLAKRNGEKFIWYSTAKNKDIKRKLSEEGEKLPTDGRLSSRSSGKSTAGEWLYDFTLREFNNKNQLINIRLVAELEFSESKVKGLVYDFNKLLQSDAENKVFVFQQIYKSEGEKICQHLEGAINVYNHKSVSNYLIAYWVTSEYKFIYKEICM